jgi:hypothetical protein
VHKNELIQLHTLLAQIKHHMEGEEPDAPTFEEYEDVGVEPTHVHRSKSDHKKAIFTLGKELASSLSEDEFSGPSQVSNRLEEIATNHEPKAKATP